MNTDSSDDPKPAAIPVAHHTDGATHPDPITGEPGAHPVGVGVGAVGAGLAGAAIGIIAGPLGALVGAAIGAVAGGLAGHEIASADDDEPVSSADQPVSTTNAAGTVLPEAASAGPNVEGMPGAVLPSPLIMNTPADSVPEPAGQFHDAFTTTTWQEAVTEERIANGDDGPAGKLPPPALESLPVGEDLSSEGFMGGEIQGSEETVRSTAYFLYLHRQASGEPGDALGDWISAEHEVLKL